MRETVTFPVGESMFALSELFSFILGSVPSEKNVPSVKMTARAPLPPRRAMLALGHLEGVQGRCEINVTFSFIQGVQWRCEINVPFSFIQHHVVTSTLHLGGAGGARV